MTCRPFSIWWCTLFHTPEECVTKNAQFGRRSMNSGEISVVIPARNRAGLIARAIKSAQRQIPAPDEIIVVDNGSTDATASIAASLGATVVQEPSAQSVGGCRNAGLRHATTAWTAFLDSDDEWLPGHL